MEKDAVKLETELKTDQRKPFGIKLSKFSIGKHAISALTKHAFCLSVIRFCFVRSV